MAGEEGFAGKNSTVLKELVMPGKKYICFTINVS